MKTSVISVGDPVTGTNTATVLPTVSIEGNAP